MVTWVRRFCPDEIDHILSRDLNLRNLGWALDHLATHLYHRPGVKWLLQKLPASAEAHRIKKIHILSCLVIAHNKLFKFNSILTNPCFGLRVKFVIPYSIIQVYLLFYIWTSGKHLTQLINTWTSNIVSSKLKRVKIGQVHNRKQ